MEVINRKLKEIQRKLANCFPKAYVTVDISIGTHSTKKEEVFIKAYIEDHKFKLSKNHCSNDCDSIEGFITHINFEMEGVEGWKPVKKLKERLV